MASSDSCEWRLKTITVSTAKRHKRLPHFLVKFDALHHFETQGEIAKVYMDTKQTNDAEIPEHSVERSLSIFTYNLAGHCNVRIHSALKAHNYSRNLLC